MVISEKANQNIVYTEHPKSGLRCHSEHYIEAGVDLNINSIGSYELTRFGAFLRLDIHFYDITEENGECPKRIDSRGDLIPDAPHISLMFDKSHLNAT